MSARVPTPESTVAAMAEALIRVADFLAAAEPDHETAILVRKLRERKHANGGH